ncbi:MAG: response regulator receiver protein [Clostridia bacterium]|jgi:two-component system chemotaxis response regulator CheY|nr:response regulator receiver protein [Clostridia bacterium]
MKKVLIVDNSSYMRMFVKKIIERGGLYSILEASGKDEAMELFKTQNPSIVILDLNMGENTMEGMEVLTDVITINPETVVIIISAVGDENVKNECIALGAKCYIKKPINTDSLLKALEEYK